MESKNIDEFINKVIQGDAIEVMRQIPDNSVDMTFADPPFNLGKIFFVEKNAKNQFKTTIHIDINQGILLAGKNRFS